MDHVVRTASIEKLARDQQEGEETRRAECGSTASTPQ
ncbi:hypothetical protein APTSU1_001043900 [Apodemus speciosus]|uniref:Uncharacterized protein n=1 Tax=Apodemus speciosus TaxID=105296 RepID=A0ABQ0F7V1_APOSI